MKSEDKPQAKKEEKQEKGKLRGHKPIESSIVRDPDPDPHTPPPGHH